MLNRNIVIKANYIPTFLQPVENLLKATDFSQQKMALLHIYYQIFKMLPWDDETVYQQLIELTRRHVPLFLDNELLLMMDYVENYSLSKINNSATSFYDEFYRISNLN